MGSYDIRSFKLINGEELIAELVQPTGLGYSIMNPLVLLTGRGPDGKGVLNFAQWSVVHEPNQEIQLFDHGLVAAPIKIIGEVADSYIQQTTGIILAPAKTSQLLMG